MRTCPYTGDSCDCSGPCYYDRIRADPIFAAEERQKRLAIACKAEVSRAREELARRKEAERLRSELAALEGPYGKSVEGLRSYAQELGSRICRECGIALPSLTRKECTACQLKRAREAS